MLLGTVGRTEDWLFVCDWRTLFRVLFVSVDDRDDTVFVSLNSDC